MQAGMVSLAANEPFDATTRVRGAGSELFRRTHRADAYNETLSSIGIAWRILPMCLTAKTG